MFPALSVFYIEVNNPVKLCCDEDKWQIQELVQSVFNKINSTRYTFSCLEKQLKAKEIFSTNKNAFVANQL